MATHFLRHCQKMCLAHLHPKANICAKLSWELVKNWGSSSRRKIFPPFLPYAVTMATHFLTTVKKCVLHIYTPRQTVCAKFHENWWKTEEVVRDARFSPHFCRIMMPLPWQHSFCHCRKMCALAHLHSKANKSLHKFHENWWTHTMRK